MQKTHDDNSNDVFHYEDYEVLSLHEDHKDEHAEPNTKITNNTDSLTADLDPETQTKTTNGHDQENLNENNFESNTKTSQDPVHEDHTSHHSESNTKAPPRAQNELEDDDHIILMIQKPVLINTPSKDSQEHTSGTPIEHLGSPVLHKVHEEWSQNGHVFSETETATEYVEALDDSEGPQNSAANRPENLDTHSTDDETFPGIHHNSEQVDNKNEAEAETTLIADQASQAKTESQNAINDKLSRLEDDMVLLGKFLVPVANDQRDSKQQSSNFHSNRIEVDHENSSHVLKSSCTLSILIILAVNLIMNLLY